MAEGTEVSFQGTATDVGGGSALAPVQWDFAYDGATFQADPSARGTLTPSHTFTAPGDYTVTLQATDLWGAVDVETLDVTVTAVPPTATVGNSGPASEGSPVTFNVSNITDVDPQATFSYWAQWSAGAGFTQISPADVMGGGSSASFTHVFDTASSPSGYAVTIRVLDSDGASTDYAQTVVVNAAAPSATFGPAAGRRW